MFHWDKKIGHDLDSVILQYCRLKPNCSQISARGWYFPNRAVCESGVWSEIGSSSVRVTALWCVCWIGGNWRALTRKPSHHNLISLSQEAQCRVAMKHLSSLVAVGPNLLGNWKSSNLHEFALFAFSIFHYISLRTFHWENWGEIQALCHSRWLCVHALWRKSVVVQASRGRSKDPRAACFGFFWDMFTSIHRYSETSLPINLPISWIFLAHLHRRFLYLENYSPFCWVFNGKLKLANVQRLVREESAEWSETVGLEQILEPLEPRASRAGLLAAWHWETADYSQWSRSCVWIYVILHTETVCVCKLWKILYIFTHCFCTISR